MYTDSNSFRDYLSLMNDEVKGFTQGKVVFEEYIIVPYFGFIILRFNLNDEHVSIDDLDYYENKLYEIVGDDYFVDFMGSVYRSVGVDFNNVSSKLKELKEKYKNEDITFNPPYKNEIQKDANELLNRAGLELNQKVWEIQDENEEINLLILGKEHKLIKTIDGDKSLNVIETGEEECLGLIKAIFYAKRNKISLGRLLT